VSTDLAMLLEQARQRATTPLDAGQGKPLDGTRSAEDRQKLLRVAQEFESMLLVQVRRAGKWDDEDEEGDQSGLGAESLFEMADSELAGHLARVQGLGLSKQLLEAFERMGIDGGAASTSPSPDVAAPLPPALPSLPVPIGPAGATISTAEPSSVLADAPTVATVEGRVTSNFGWRRDPFTGQAKFHRGVDLAAVYGQDVQAARAGRVVFSGGQGGYGNTVVVEHADGTRTRYAHLSATLVAQGDAVDAGQPLGRAGHSGRATGTHVHFEVTAADGRPLSPDGWLKKT
jgi:murein DD-endopeptidase MepM/ murein hydrolase activator NlpD